MYNIRWAGIKKREAFSKFQDFLNNSRIYTNPKNDFAFFQTLAHLFLFDEKVKCRWISLELISWGQYSERKICCCLFISSITHEIRHFQTETYQNSVHIKTYCFFDVLNAWSSSLLKLPNYWKISVPFLSQGISQACISGRFLLQRCSI